MARTLEDVIHSLLGSPANVSSPTSSQSILATLTTKFGGSSKWSVEDSGSNFCRMQSQSSYTPDLEIMFGADDTTPPQGGAMEAPSVATSDELYCTISPDGGQMGSPPANPWAAASKSALWDTERSIGWTSVVDDSMITTTGIDQVEVLEADERCFVVFRRSSIYFVMDVGAIGAAIDDDSAESDKRVYGIHTCSDVQFSASMWTTTSGDVVFGTGPTGVHADTHSLWHVFDPKNPSSVIQVYQPLRLAASNALNFEDEDGYQSHLGLPLLRQTNHKLLAYWRQTRMGRQAAMLDIVTDGATEKSFAISRTKAGLNDTLWVDNF
jgi:hypothetical protein